MAHAISVRPKNGYLHLVVTGDNTEEDVRAYLDEVVEACSARRCSNVLIEENLQGPGLSLGTMFAIIDEKKGPAAAVLRRLAYVDVNPQHSRQALQVAEVVATNRAIGLRLFSDVAGAEAWLREELRKEGGAA